MTAVLPQPAPSAPSGGRLIDQFEYGLDAPICLTWELTYACNLACVHCLSSSGRRDPRELSTAEAEAVIDELQRMQVFYVNVGGGEPTVRPDFWHLLDYAIGHDVGVKFSTNGIKLDKARAAAAGPHRLRRRADLPGRRDRRGQRRRPRHRLLRHRHPRAGEPGRGRDEGLQGLRRRHPRERRPARRVQGPHRPLRRPAADHPASGPSGRGADVWDRLHPTQAQQRELYAWLLANGDKRAHRRLVLPPVGARRGPARAEPVRRRPGGLPDRPGRRRLRLPVRHPRELPRRQRARRGRLPAGVAASASCSPTCAARRPAAPARSAPHFDACRGGCMAAKFFTGLPLDGPDPECVQGYGETRAGRPRPRSWSPRAATSTTRGRPARSRRSPGRTRGRVRRAAGR